MGTADSGTTTVHEDGVTVTKALRSEQFEHPTVELTIQAERAEPATVRITDTVPGGSSSEYVGFHPEYGGEYWSIDGDQLVFERVFESGETYVTVYGVRGLNVAGIGPDLGAPVVAVEPLDTGDTVTEQVSNVLGSPGSSDTESRSEADDEADAPTEPSDTPQAMDPEPADPPPDGPPSGPDDSLVARLAAEIRTGEPDEDELEQLRDELGVANRRTEARIQHLQNEVSDLAAYTQAIEEFLDEYGTGSQLVAEIDQEFDDLRAQVDDLAATVSEIEDEIAALDQDVRDISGDVDDVKRFTDRLREGLGGVLGEERE